jgi:hypothetical protein
MSNASAQAHQFYREVAKNREVWTVRKGDVLAKATLRDGKTSTPFWPTTPFWSTRTRIERVLQSIPVYAGSEPVRITFDEFTRDWIPRIRQEQGLLGINWSGPSLRGFNLDPDFVLRAIAFYESEA